jgi:hypothetical protein
VELVAREPPRQEIAYGVHAPSEGKLETSSFASGSPRAYRFYENSSASRIFPSGKISFTDFPEGPLFFIYPVTRSSACPRLTLREANKNLGLEFGESKYALPSHAAQSAQPQRNKNLRDTNYDALTFSQIFPSHAADLFIHHCGLCSHLILLRHGRGWA